MSGRHSLERVRLINASFGMQPQGAEISSVCKGKETEMARRGLNKVMLIGKLGRDPESRKTQSGASVTNFSIATSTTWRDRQTGERQERTEWHRVVCFGGVAEFVGSYLRKGALVYVEGSLRTSKWEQDGETRYRTEIVARDVEAMDTRPDPHGGGQDEFAESGVSGGDDLEPGMRGSSKFAVDQDDEGMPF